MAQEILQCGITTQNRLYLAEIILQRIILPCCYALRKVAPHRQLPRAGKALQEQSKQQAMRDAPEEVRGMKHAAGLTQPAEMLADHKYGQPSAYQQIYGPETFKPVQQQ